MNEAENFLDELRALVELIPAIVPADPDPPYGELMATELDTRELSCAYQALPDHLKHVIAAEWAEFMALANEANAVHFMANDLYQRCGVRLGLLDEECDEETTAPYKSASGRPRLAIVRNEISDDTPSSPLFVGSRLWTDNPDEPESQVQPAVAGPAQMASSAELDPQVSGRWVMPVIGCLTAVAAIMSVMVLSDSPPSQADTATPLPVADWEFPTCQPEARSIPSRPPVMATPQRRKASTARFVKDTDSVILKRKNKPSLRVSVTEVPDGEPPAKERQSRVHTVDLDKMSGLGLEIAIGDDTADLRLALEVGE